MLTQKLFGKYRARVLNNLDPLFLARLQIEVPSLPSLLLGWALPCLPYAGSNPHLYTLPPIGTNVWIEFEASDPNHPIWSGVFFTTPQLP